MVDADHLARAMLLDVDAGDAPGRVRSWASTVAAGARLWEAIPEMVQGGAQERRRLFERVTALAVSVEDDRRVSRWPGDGPGDPDLAGIIANLDWAHDLVLRYAGELPTHRPEVHRDLEAARVRLVHTLYVATHAVVVSLTEDGRRRAADPSRVEAIRAAATISNGVYQVGPGVRWARRLGVAERVLGDYLHPSRYVEALGGEQAAPVLGLPRLSAALAGVDIQSHRTLTAAPRAANVAMACAAQAVLCAAAVVLVRSAAETGRLERADPVRLGRGLEGAGEAWSGLARRWAVLIPRGADRDPALVVAAAQLRAACRELTHAGDRLASPATVADRVDLAAVIPVLAHHVDAAGEIAEAVRSAGNRPGLLVPAREGARLVLRDIETGMAPPVPDGLSADLLALSARGDRLLPVPGPLRDVLDAGALRAAAATAAASAGLCAALDPVAAGGPGPHRGQAVRAGVERAAPTGPLAGPPVDARSGPSW